MILPIRRAETSVPSDNGNPASISAPEDDALAIIAEVEPNRAAAGDPGPGRIGNARLTEGPVARAVFALALPVLGEQLLNACVTWNDAILAGRISAEATGAVGVAGYVGWMITMLSALVSVGATAIVSRAIGAGNRAEADRTVRQTLLLAMALGVVGTAGIQFAAPMFARLLNMQGLASDIAVDYMRIDSLGYLASAVTLGLAACLRGAGDTRTPMFVLGAVNVLNFALSWVLTFGLGPIEGIGVNGIAWGTTLSRWLGAAGIILMIVQPRSLVHLDLGLLRPDVPLVRRMIRVGAPAALDGVLVFGGHFLFMTVVARVPSDFSAPVLYAAHIVGIRIESLSYLPATAWSIAASTLVGQNLGARRIDRARRAAHVAAGQSAMLLGITAGLYLFAAAPFYRLLSNDPQVWACGVPALQALALFQLTLAPLTVYLGALRGAGDTRVPMIYTVIGLLGVRVPVALFGGFVLRWGLVGAWLGMFADLSVRAFLLWRRFRAGAWERIRV